jgi:hypothetical protein
MFIWKRISQTLYHKLNDLKFMTMWQEVQHFQTIKLKKFENREGLDSFQFLISR